MRTVSSERLVCPVPSCALTPPLQISRSRWLPAFDTCSSQIGSRPAGWQSCTDTSGGSMPMRRMDPKPDFNYDSYKGNGKLTGKVLDSDHPCPPGMTHHCRWAGAPDAVGVPHPSALHLRARRGSCLPDSG